MQRLSTWWYDEAQATEVYEGADAEDDWYDFMQENETSHVVHTPPAPRSRPRRHPRLDEDDVPGRMYETPFTDTQYYKGKGFRPDTRGN
jgi:hypothetical protein